MLQQCLPYFKDCNRYYLAVADLNLPVLLNSQGAGRYDIVVAQPFYQLSAYGECTMITEPGLNDQNSQQDFWHLLTQALSSRQPSCGDGVFCGGAVGFLGYGLGKIQSNEYACPDAMVGIYDWALVLDHKKQTANLYSACQHQSTADIWQDLICRFSHLPNLPAEPFSLCQATTNLSFTEYQACFNKVKDYIVAGDCYQVNLAQRLRFKFLGSSFAAYHKLQTSKAAFGAYLKGQNYEILSFSPERFLKVVYPLVETRPIKGTRPRALNPMQDQALIDELQTSPKDQAENLMIVDLLRNDLSKVCEPHSVKVPKLFEVESLPAVHHLVSTVTGKLKPGVSPVALLQACFPGGSITGAPKIRAMEVIDELEPNQRGPYCGSIFYIGWDWSMDSNIAIRTLLREKDNLYCWAGGGVVYDSDALSEYQETQDKIAWILKMLEINFPNTPS